MTTIDTTASSAPSAGTGLACVAEWLTTTDHKRIGRLYIVGGAFSFVAAIVVAVLLGAERISTSNELLSGNSLPQLFSIERFGLTYLGLAPLILGVAVAVVPLQLGARSLALPRVAAAGFWLWLLGAVLAVYSILCNGGPNGGNPRFVELFMMSAVLVIAGLVAAVVCLATTSILTTRAPGMNMRRIPYFSWSVLIASLTLLIARPVVAGDLLFTWLAYRYPSSENVLSVSHAINDGVGFGFSQPTTLLFAIPVFGFLAETTATATGRRLQPRGVLFTAVGLVGVAVFATVVQAPVTLRTGFSALELGDKLSDLVPFALVHGLPLLGAFVAFALVAKNLATRPKLQAPLFFAVFAALLALSAAAASALLHISDAALAGTTFEEGNWLMVVLAGALAAMGAVVYWGPKWWGRAMPNKAVLPLALLTFLGAELATLPLLIAGFADQPGAVFPAIGNGSDAVVNFDYSGNPGLWNTLSTVGLGLVALAVLAFVALALRSFRGDANADNDPWNGQTLEWATTSPAPADNFSVVHIVSSAEPILDLQVAERAAPDARASSRPTSRTTSATLRRHRRRLRRTGCLARRHDGPLPTAARPFAGRDRPLAAQGRRRTDGAGQPDVVCDGLRCHRVAVAVYSARRDDRVHTGVALWLVAFLAAAIINAEVNIYERMQVPATGETFNTMFYALTGVMVVLFIAGGLFSAITAFRYLGRRTTDRELVTAHALYWYFLSFAFSMLWFVIYVTK